MARLVTKAFSALRIARLRGRSALMRLHLRLAFPAVRCHRSVRFGRGVRIRAFDGGSVSIDAMTQIRDFALIEAHSGEISIGRDCWIGPGSVLVCREGIDIGSGSLIAEYVTIRDQDHRHDGTAPLAAQGFAVAPILIAEQVWIGAKTTVTRGVEIGAHAVVAANAVVTRSVAARTTVAGVPARPIRGSSSRNIEAEPGRR